MVLPKMSNLGDSTASALVREGWVFKLTTKSRWVKRYARAYQTVCVTIANDSMNSLQK